MTKIKSTYEKLIEKLNPQELREFEQDYQNLLISELNLAMMHKDYITARKLAQEKTNHN